MLDSVYASHGSFEFDVCDEYKATLGFIVRYILMFVKQDRDHKSVSRIKFEMGFITEDLRGSSLL